MGDADVWNAALDAVARALSAVSKALAGGDGVVPAHNAIVSAGGGELDARLSEAASARSAIELSGDACRHTIEI